MATGSLPDWLDERPARLPHDCRSGLLRVFATRHFAAEASRAHQHGRGGSNGQAGRAGTPAAAQRQAGPPTPLPRTDAADRSLSADQRPADDMPRAEPTDPTRAGDRGKRRRRWLGRKRRRSSGRFHAAGNLLTLGSRRACSLGMSPPKAQRRLSAGALPPSRVTRATEAHQQQDTLPVQSGARGGSATFRTHHCRRQRRVGVITGLIAPRAQCVVVWRVVRSMFYSRSCAVGRRSRKPTVQRSDGRRPGRARRQGPSRSRAPEHREAMQPKA